jgi:MFS family permease
MATRQPFRALHQAGFRRFYLGQIVSSSGTFMQSTALGWLVLQETGSAAKLGLVIAAGSLPTLVIGPWGGPLADRANRRVLLLCTQTAFGLLATALWVAAAAHVASLPVVIAISLAGGIVQVADSPARQAFVAELVPPEDLASAVSLNGVVVNSSRVVGPAVAGILIATVGTTPCFAVNAISYVAVVVALLTIHPRPAPRVTRHGGVRAGLRYAASRHQLWLPLAMMSLIGLVAFNFVVVLPVLAERVFDLRIVVDLLGIGSITGSLSVGLIRHPRRIYLAAAACAFGAGLAGSVWIRLFRHDTGSAVCSPAGSPPLPVPARNCWPALVPAFRRGSEALPSAPVRIPTPRLQPPPKMVHADWLSPRPALSTL